MREWDPPFPVDLDAIRPRDEAFWDEHRATPKAFFAPATAKLWSTRFGATTSMRIAAPPAQDAAASTAMAPAAATAAIAPATVISPACCASASTPSCREPPIPPRSASASTRCASAASPPSAGATDFRWLFLGFSSFLIASAAILVGALLHARVERRASEIGLFLATGFPLRMVRRRFLVEGLLLATIGIAIGGGRRRALRRAHDRRAAHLVARRGGHALPLPARRAADAGRGGDSPRSWSWRSRSCCRCGGWVGSRWWRSCAAPPPSPTLARRLRPTAASRWVWRVAAVLGVVLLAAGAAAGLESSPAIFFAAGASLLVAGLAFFAMRLRRPRGRLRAGARYLPMAARNATLNPGRSLLVGGAGGGGGVRHRRGGRQRVPLRRRSGRARLAGGRLHRGRRIRGAAARRSRLEGRRRSSSVCSPPPASSSPRPRPPRSASCPATT